MKRRSRIKTDVEPVETKNEEKTKNKMGDWESEHGS